MPFSISNKASPSEISDAVNYLLSNFAQVQAVNPNSGQITTSSFGVTGYLYKYLNVKYADSFDGSVNFSNSPANRLYYGLRNNDSSVESTLYSDYVWTPVTGGFGTTKFFFYATSGGRQIQTTVATTAPASGWAVDTGAAIDLDIVTFVLASVTSFSAGTTGFTPNTPTQGTVVLAGTLGVANGGTGVTTSTGTGSVVLSTNPSLTTPTQVTYENWTPISAPAYAEGRVWYDSTQKSLAYFNDVTNNALHIGQETQLKVYNNTGSTINRGAPVYITSTSSGFSYPLVALAQANTQITGHAIGLANQSIPNATAGYVTIAGLVNGLSLGAMTVGDTVYVSPYSAGQLMNTYPPTGYPIRIGVVAYANTPNGAIYVNQSNAYVLANGVVGTLAIANGGTNGSAVPTAGAVPYGTGTAYAFTAAGTTGQVLTSNGAGVPTWTTNAGGDVTGPASSTDNAIARFDGVTGKLIQNSVTTIDDTGAATGFTTFSASTSVTTPIVQASNSAGLSLKNASGTTQMSVGAGGGDNMSINVSTNLNGTNAQIDLSPTGTGHVHIKPTGVNSVEIAPTFVGEMDNITIGATTPKNGSFVDLSVTGTTSFDGSQGTAGQVLTSAGTGATPTWTTPTTGTITSVSFTGGIVTVATPITTPALTVAGTSGGVVYFASGTTWASSAALAANAIVLGGGAGAAPATTTTGTGVVTALGANVGTAGAFVVNGGALGTPSSGTVTNLTGTASININGTVGATTANTGSFTSLAYTTTLTGGTGIVNLGSGQFYKAASGDIGIGTTDNQLFNTVGGTTKLAVVGSSSSTDILGNTDASISIINTDTTANNTAGLHFARADTDDTPNYAGASIVAQFPEAQVTGQYPKGLLAFLTSTATNQAPSEKMRIGADGVVTMSAYGAGAATFSAAGVISSVSDETWKIKDGVPVDPDSMLNKLEPGYWYYNDEKKETFGVDRQLGFYAQNVNAAIGPEAAPTPEEGKPWGYYDRSVLAVTVMSLQKALATIDSLTARIAVLEAK